MGNLALIYPKISKADFETIQNIRKQHDPKYYDIVDPHITLVFSTEKLSADELYEHVKSKLSDTESFSVKFDSAKLVEDDSKDFYHAFLIPSDGFDEINTVHDLLYTDALESELRQDIPFIPHLGIGTGTEAEMTQLVSELNNSDLSISGIADTITVVKYDGQKVTDLQDVDL